MVSRKNATSSWLRCLNFFLKMCPIWESEKLRQRNREEYLQSQVNELWRTIPASKQAAAADTKLTFPKESQENILYFLEKNAPLLDPWQREIIRIVRKIAAAFSYCMASEAFSICTRRVLKTSLFFPFKKRTVWSTTDWYSAGVHLLTQGAMHRLIE